MSETIHFLVERYGLLAVFLGSVAEGETAAILAGFFAHQKVFAPWAAFAAAAVGAFMGDVIFFVAGRRFCDHPRLRRLRGTPAFARAMSWIERHPNLFVLSNRYVYGFRLVGGVAAGLSSIPVGRFLVLNALSAASWAVLFGGLGYFVGLGAEELVGEAFERHERLFIALGLAVVGIVAARLLVVFNRRRRLSAAPGPRRPDPESAE